MFMMRAILVLSICLYLVVQFNFYDKSREEKPPVLLFLQVIEPHDISVALNTRKLWSMHLHVQAKLIQEIVRSFSGSSCQPIQHMLRRICVQLCDLASPTALLIMRTVLDLIVEDLQRYFGFPLQRMEFGMEFGIWNSVWHGIWHFHFFNGLLNLTRFCAVDLAGEKHFHSVMNRMSISEFSVQFYIPCSDTALCGQQTMSYRYSVSHYVHGKYFRKAFFRLSLQSLIYSVNFYTTCLK